MKVQSKLPAAIVILALSFAMVANTSATVLIFNNAAGGPVTNNFSQIPQDYGDNVTGTVQGAFSYGVGAEGFTPHVIAEYGSALGGPPIGFYDSGFGNLTNVIGFGAPTILMGLTTPAPGREGVKLYSLDLGGYPGTVGGVRSNVTLTIRNEALGIMYETIHTTVSNSPNHSTFDFSANPLAAQSIYIFLYLGDDTSNYGNIGMDNIVFGEIPEPSTLSFLGGAGLLFWRRMKQVK